MRAASDTRLFTGLLGALIIFTWVVLWAWGRSPYGRFLGHEALGEVAIGADAFWLWVLFVAGWTLMTVAMMLPTSLPLVALFHTVVRQRPNRTRLVVLLIVGYLGTWMAFGAVVHLGDWGLHRAALQSAWLTSNAWVIGAAILAVAGVYQFTPLKYRCLDKCRSPFSFIVEHWRGGREKAEAFRLGVHHGMFCIGCCWSLMLLMFAVGVGNIGWMLALGTVMAVEKNVPWGRRLSAPLGAFLVGWAAYVIGSGLIG